VTRFLLDANVISETTKPKPEPNVIRWIAQLSPITLPAVGVYEIASGIQRLPASKKFFAAVKVDPEVGTTSLAERG